MRPPPAWLAELQDRFTEVLRRPLRTGSGTLEADRKRFPAAARADIQSEHGGLSAAARLSAYNQQYWFRLFTTLHNEALLTARLFGLWRFNKLAMGFLLENPPRDIDLAHVARGLSDYLERELPETIVLDSGRRLQKRAVLEAARLDEIWQRVALAPDVPPFRPGPEDMASLPERRLRPAPSFAVFEEHWPLLALRVRLANDLGEGEITLPPGLPEPAHHAFFHVEDGIGHVPLERLEAELFAHAQRLPFAGALGHVEASCPEDERAALPGKVSQWLARSVALGFWAGAD